LLAGPVLFYLAAPANASRPLGVIKEFMSDHDAVIMFIVLLVLGAELTANGISGLST
jgi:hypothetical protein